MRETWSTSGVDLHLDVRGPRVRAGLETALREAVRGGRLPEGARLPSSRALAAELGVARNTVVAAYGQLVAEGWLEAVHGSGTRVAARPSATDVPTVPGPQESRAHRYSLRPGLPDLGAFPRPGWIAAARRALRAADYTALAYDHPQGRPELRAALAEYLGRARGVHAPLERIVVCSGFTQGLTLLCHALRARGARVFAVEAFGHSVHRSIPPRLGLEPNAIRVDGDGARVEELGDADAVLLTPAHQFPLGTTLVPGRRLHAVRWARERGAVVVEDDYDGEFRYDRQPIGAMQGIAPEQVVYAGTASKSLAPGLRLAWLVVPRDLLDAVVAARQLTDGPGTLEQLTLAELIASGAYDRHVRRSRLVYRRRRDSLVRTLLRRVPQARVTGIVAGLHALLELPEGMSEDEIVARALGHGVALEALGSYSAGVQLHRPALVVGYGTPPEHAFTGAVARLCAALRDGDVSGVHPAEG